MTCKKLAEFLASMGVETSPSKLRKSCRKHKTWTKEGVFCFVPVLDIETRNDLEAFLMQKGLTVDRSYMMETPQVVVKVNYRLKDKK